MAIERLRVSERSGSAVMAFDVLDATGAPVPLAALTSATLTLFDWDTTGSPATGILNGRADQDVLNANDVVIDSGGHVVWSLQPDDNVIVTARRQVERHRARFAFAWGGDTPGETTVTWEIEVRNLRLS